MSKKLTDFFLSNKEKPTLTKEQETSESAPANISNDNSSQNFSFSDDIETPYHPPSTFSFPKTTFGKKDLSCQASWFVKFPWLHYDER